MFRLEQVWRLRTDRLLCVSLRPVSLKDLRDEESSTHVNTKTPKCIAPFLTHFCTIEHVFCCKETDLLLLLAKTAFGHSLEISSVLYSTYSVESKISVQPSLRKVNDKKWPRHKTTQQPSWLTIGQHSQHTVTRAGIKERWRVQFFGVFPGRKKLVFWKQEKLAFRRRFTQDTRSALTILRGVVGWSNIAFLLLWLVRRPRVG